MRYKDFSFTDPDVWDPTKRDSVDVVSVSDENRTALMILTALATATGSADPVNAGLLIMEEFAEEAITPWALSRIVGELREGKYG